VVEEPLNHVAVDEPLASGHVGRRDLHLAEGIYLDQLVFARDVQEGPGEGEPLGHCRGRQVLGQEPGFELVASPRTAQKARTLNPGLASFVPEAVGPPIQVRLSTARMLDRQSPVVRLENLTYRPRSTPVLLPTRSVGAPMRSSMLSQRLQMGCSLS